MNKIIQIDIMHNYKKWGFTPQGEEELQEHSDKYSYAIVGDYGLFEYGKITTGEFFDYSAPFHCSTKITNASNEDIVIKIIEEELSYDGSKLENSFEIVNRIDYSEVKKVPEL